MDREEFVQLVEKAYEEIPDVFKEKMENIEIIVEDFPTPYDLEQLGIRSRNSLLGLYRGTPLPHRSVWHGVRLPDTIILFQKKIESRARDRTLFRLIR